MAARSSSWVLWALAGHAIIAGLPATAQGTGGPVGTTVGGATARLIGDRGPIAVIELEGNYDERLADGEVNHDPRQAVAQEFFSTHPDEYDFLVVWSTFEFNTREASAFFLPVRNDVQGVGLPLFDHSDLFGSAQQLQGYVDMAALSRWATDPLAPGFEDTLAVLGHEILHRWGAHVRFRDADGSLSSALLGRDDSHWSYLLDTDASLLYGAEWRENGDGSFTAAAVLKFWSPLDLYLAGFYAPEQVPPFFLIESPGVDPAQLPRPGVTVSGAKRVVTIEDILAAEGPRVPSSAESQKEFRAAFLLVTRPGEPVSDAQIAGLNRVRRELSTRFAALTGGRGVLDVEPQAVPGTPGVPTPIPGGGEPRPGPASLADGLAWLRARQTAQGFWEDTPATRVRDTAVTLATLSALDPQFTRAGEAVAWLRAQTGSNTDFAARLAAVLQKVGGDGAAARAALVALQNADGGWGAGAGYGSDPVDTALAVLALTAATPSTPESAAVGQAAGYLAAAQNADGGWGSLQGGPSRTAATATVLRALRAAGQDSGSASRALAWMASRQSSTDGGFGDSPSTIHDTAQAVDALIAVQALGQIDSAAAAAYLGSRQTTEGSWDGSVYSTALAVSALKRFGFPNWSFAGEPIASPASPRDGERVRLAFTVVNDGNVPSPAGVLRLFEEDPAQGGEPAAADAAIPALAPGTSVTVKLYWDSLDKPGPRTLFALIDPEGAVAELSESDNGTSTLLDVQPAPALADLEVQATDIAINPAQPASLPAELAIAVAVRNLGHADAAAVAVQLLTGPVEGGAPVERKTVSIPGRSSAVVSFIYTLATPGTTTFSVVVDPDGAVPEDQEDNNTASRTVSTGPSLDLAVADSDLSLAGTPFVGSDVSFKAALHNRGTVDAPAAQVRFAVTDGTATREIGRLSILLGAGQSAERTVAWRVDLEGSLQLLVTIDPDALVPEADETNNVGSLSFTTGQPTQANLVLRAEDFTLAPSPGLQGQPLTLRAVVRNNGGQPAANVEVGFYEGNPAQGGSLVGDLRVIPSLAAGESAEVSLTLPPLPDAAAHLFFAVADPRGQIAEVAEDDNAAFQALSVRSLPDLSVSAASIQVSPPTPRPGQPVTVTVDVANLGQQEARDVGVRLLADGSPVGADQHLPAIAGNAVARASFVGTFPVTASTVRLQATADPDGAIAEGSEANNAAERTVTGVDESQPVVPRYFSPNGDGVQDTAAFGLPSPLPAGAVVAVRDAQGQLVRQAAGAVLASGAFEWDGRDDLGRVVSDGDYTLSLLDAAGNLMRDGLVTVDTDHLPLLAAIGTPFEKTTNLTCDRAAAGLEFPATDDRFYFRNTAGIHRGLPNGQGIERIIPASYPFHFRVSRDGEWVVFTEDRSWPGDKKYARSDGSGLTTIPIQSNSGRFDFIFRGDSQDLVYAQQLDSNANPPATVRLRPLNGSGPDRLVAALPRDADPYHGDLYFSQTYWHDDLAPDGRTLVVDTCAEANANCTRRDLYLVDLATGRLILLPVHPPTFYFRFYYLRLWSWSPDGALLAVVVLHDSADRAEVEVYSREGALVRRFEIPMDPIIALPVYSQFGPVPSGLIEVDEVFQPSWSSAGQEFVFGVRYFDSGDSHFHQYGRLFRANVATGALTTVGWLEPRLIFSYHVSTWDGARWVERGQLHHGSRSSQQQLDLSRYLPDPDGEYKVRLRQSGRGAAQVDRVQLRTGPRGAELELPPAAATVGSEDALAKVVRFDRELLDLHEREMEVRWTTIPEAASRQGLRLDLVAREEGPEVRDARPFEYPAEPGRVYNLLAGEGGRLVVDGAQTAEDGLAEPLFAEWTRPDTGHPAAVVYGYAKSDGADLYAALDFTVDNTEEGERDWASVWIDTAAGPREFRISAAQAAWGRVSFTHTGKVHHGHKYYEWKVPLSEIGARPGDSLSIRFQAYGSAGLLPETSFLPLNGFTPLWMPGEDVALFWEDGSGSTWAVPLDGTSAPRRIFETFNTFSDAYLSASRHKLLFLDGRDILDPQHDCYNPYLESSYFSYESRANLTAELSGRTAEDGRGILLEGTAADLHLARWRLEYADESVPGFWTALGPDVEEPVFDALLTTWVPPRAGSFLVQLTVEDLAGNSKTVIRRFSSGSQTATTITDVSVSPRTISPNGDGVLDATTVRYRVLAPVHLELHVDNARGDRLRTFRRDHATVGETFEIVWDGRDDRGLPVPDGVYRLVLQSYVFFVRVDTTPPAVTARLEGPRGAVQVAGVSYVAVQPTLTWKVTDASQFTWSLQTGEGAEPALWRGFLPLTLPGEPQSGFLSLAEFVNHNFRLVAQDTAGNRGSATTGLGDEQLIVDGFGQHQAADGSVAALNRIPLSGTMGQVFERQPVRFGAAESIRQRLGQVFLQFRSSDQQPWVETPIQQFLVPGSANAGTQIPDPRWELVWNLSGVTGSQVTARLRAIDLDGHEFFSNAVTFALLGGIEYGGLVPGKDEADWSHLPGAVKAALTAAKLDPDQAPALWAVESLLEPLTGVTLFLTSTDDPRYAAGRPLPLAGSSGDALVFDGSDLAPCAHYTGYVVARTAPPSGTPRDVKSGAKTDQVPCLELTLELQVEAACGTPPPRRTTALLTPISLNGAELRSLLLAVSTPDNVVANVNAPASGREYAIDIDTAGMSESEIPLYARLTNGEGEEKRVRARLVVDRSVPEVAFTYPTNGQKVCSVWRQDGSRGVDLEASIEDLGGLVYRIQKPDPSSPDGWLTLEKETVLYPPIPPDQPNAEDTVLPLRRVEKHGPVFSLGPSDGGFHFRLEAEDRGGNRVCPEVAFTVDGIVEGASLTTEPEFFSPNGDGELDQALLRFGASEPGVVNVQIYEGRKSAAFGGPPIVPTGPALRTLISDLSLAGFGSAVWDGRGDGGAQLTDGVYVAVARFRDGCANVVERYAALQLDTTPPSVSLTAPQAGTPLTMLVEVRGSVADLHLLDYRVEFGVGGEPFTWTLLGQGNGVRLDARLALWNTYGLIGPHTVRLSARDRAGNVGQSLVTVEIPSREALLTDFEAVPDLISPNGDGRRDATALRFGLAVEARVTLEILDGEGAALRTLVDRQVLPAGAAVRPWDGTDGAGGPVPDGIYVVRIQAVATANAAVTQDELVPVVLDRQPPVFELTRPRNGFASAASGVVGSLRDPHLLSYSISLTETPDAPVWSEIARGTAAQEDAPLASLEGREEGPYALLLTAVDGAENRTERVVPFEIDNEVPEVAFSAPTAGAVVGAAGGAVGVSGSVAEAHLAGWRLEVGAGSEPVGWSLLASGTTAPGSPALAAWSVANLADGTYTLRLTAEDEAGSTGQAAVAVVVDNTPPAAALDQPAADGSITGPLAVLGTAADANLLQYRLEVAPAGTQQWTELGRAATAVTSGLLLDWRNLPPDGRYQLRLRVEDRAGNAAAVVVAVTVDRQPPAAPQGLAATIENGADARLTWRANAEPDLAGYHVFREGVRVTIQPVASPAYLDGGLLDGTFHYTVTAVDRAGLESDPSAAAEVLLDRTPPTALLHRPAEASRVSGLVEVAVTAGAPDFKEYRLLVGPAGEPASRQLLKRSTVPASYQAVAQWPTAALPEGAAYTLRLEAEDIRGNVGVSESTVTIDNLPPATPAGLAAAVAGTDATLTWTKSSETDLLGYLLYRDGRLVNATGPAAGDLRSFALKLKDIDPARYVDRGLADGTFRYTLAAIDQAGNVSAPSAPVTVTIERRAPQATIATPANGSRIDRTAYILATSPDQDVARVLFQVQAASETTWTDLGPADTAAPWEASWDPSGQPYGDYRLRAVATDTGERTDAAPAAVSVTYTDLGRPAVPQGLAARVDGGDVHLSWSANAETDLAGYLLDRVAENGTPVRLTASPITAESYLNAGLPDAVYAYTVTAVDQYGNASDPSEPREAVVYTPDLERPFTPTRALETSLAGTVAPGAQVAIQVRSSALAPVAADGEGRFTLGPIALVRGDNPISVVATDGAGNRSKTASLTVVSGLPPAAPTGLAATVESYDVHLAWNANPPAEEVAGYRPFRNGEPVLFDEPIAAFTEISASSDVAGAPAAFDGGLYDDWAPVTGPELPSAGQWIAARWAAPRRLTGVEVDWLFSYYAAYHAVDFDLAVWDGGGWLTIARVRDNSQTHVPVVFPEPYLTTGVRLVLRKIAGDDADDRPVRLAEVAVLEQRLVSGTSYTDTAPDGHQIYTLSAVNPFGESGPSEPVTVPVGDVAPPEAVTLSATVEGSVVHLAWTASEATDFLRYEIRRDGQPLWEVYDVAQLSFDDTLVPNGVHRYVVRVTDQVGNPGAPSNEVEVTVAVSPPPAPIGLTVAAPLSGGALDLAWQPGAGAAAAAFRVLRATVAGGPYTEVATVVVVTYRDRGVGNGTTYFYVVEALDAIGNASARSNEASGTPADTLAPAAPVLHFPGFPGLPYRTDRTLAERIVGTAEAGAAVTLFRAGAATAQATASGEPVVERTGLFNYSPRLSPDGETLWLDDYYEHEIYRFETGATSPVSGVDGSVRWFASGDRVAFAGYGSSGSILRSYRIADGAIQDLAAAGWASIVVPSPDGGRLAFLGEREGTEGLLVLDLSSAAVTRLGTALDWEIDEESVRWSPDGARLAYLRTYPANAIEVAAVATGAVTVVETQPGDAPPSWSPDGSALVYTSIADGWEQVWRFRLSDGAAQALTSDPMDHLLPVWSPDGGAVAYVVDGRRLVVHDLASGELADLFTYQSYYFDNWLAWEKGGRLVTVDDGEPIRITPAGRFAVRDLSLAEGDNAFTATARDDAGQNGAASQPMVLTVPPSNRPDLVVAAEDLTVLPAVPLAGGAASLSVTVSNAGSASSPVSELTLALVRPDGTSAVVAERVAVNPVASGASQTMNREVTLPADPGRYRLVAAVDPLDRVSESDEGNNRAERPFVVAGSAAPILFAATDRASYAGGDEVRILLEVVNGGPAFSGQIRVTIEDAGGELVEALPALDVTALAYGETLSREVSWPAGTVFAGSYRARARLLDGAGRLVTEATAPFAIGAFAQVTAGIETDRGTYAAGATVRLAGTVAYRAGNEPLMGAVARLQVFGAGESPLAELVRPLGDLLPGSEGSVAGDWPSASAPAGSYRARLAVERAGVVLTTAETRFELTDGPLSVEGSLTLSNREPAWGISLEVSLSARNRGAAPLAQLPVRVRVLDPSAGTVLGAAALTLDLPGGGAANRTVSFDSRTLGLGNRLVVLEADLPDRTVTLDAASLTVVDRTAPEVSVVAPAAGSLVGADLDVLISARDGQSPVRRGAASLDGGAWQPLDLRDAVAGRYGRTFTALSEGAHTLSAQATDSWANVGETGPVAFTVDATPPAITVAGVENGATYSEPVTPVFTVTDEHPGTQSATLNGQPFTSGTQVAEAGSHTLRIEAVDAAGNQATVTVSFTLSTGEPAIAAAKTALLATDGDGDGNPSPGDVLEYQVTIANTGSARATGVSFLDPLPAYTLIVAGSVTSSAGAVESESPVGVAVGELAAGSQVTVRFRVAVDATVPAGVTSISNQGTVASGELPSVPTDDPAVGGTADPTVTAITAAPRLAAELTDALGVDADASGRPSPGDTLEYRVEVRNSGNTSATSVVLTAPVPAHTSPVAGSATTTAGVVAGFDATGGLRVEIGELTGGQTATVTFRVEVENPVPAGVREIALQGTLTSTELAAVATDDPDVGGTADPTVTPITAAPILTATKTALLFADADGNTVASPGDTLLYRIEVTNGGNTGATAVELADALPAGTALEAGSIQASQGTVASEEPVRVDLGEIAASASATVSFQVRIVSPFPRSLAAVSNQANVTSAELPTVLTDDPATPVPADPTATPVTAAPVLSATKTAVLAADADADGRPSPGDVLEYQVTLTNTGNTSATGVAFADPAPAYTLIVPGSIVVSAGTVESESPAAVQVGELAATGRIDIRFQVEIDPVVPAGVISITNQGALTSGELPTVTTDDPALGGAADPTVTTITAAPRPVAELTDSLAVDADANGTSSPADTLEYRAVVRNTGNTSATGVVLTAPIPAHTAPVAGSAASTAGTVVGFDAGGLRVEIGEIAGAQAVTVTFRVQVDATVPTGVREVSLQGMVTSAELPALPTDDPRAGGGADPTVTPIVAAPALSATKAAVLLTDADGDSIASPGDTLLYRIVVGNSGNTPATQARVTDPLPAGVELEAGSVQTSHGSVLAESPVQVSLGEIAAGTAATVTFRVRIASPFPPSLGVVSNQASVASAELPAAASDDPATPVVGDPTVTPVTITPRMAIDSAAGGEGEGSLVFFVRLSVPTEHEVRVDWATADGTALAGTDYQAATGSVAFASGETVKSIQIALVDDAVNEPEETFRVRTTGISGAIPSIPEATGLIRDDDAPPVFHLEVSDTTATEGTQGTALFTVTLSEPASAEVRTAYATADGTARAGADYLATAGTLAFAPGETVRTIAVPVLDDGLLEPAETFFLDLSNPLGADLRRARGTATLQDDELCEGPNLIVNPGAELPSPPFQSAVVLPGWTAMGTALWRQRTADPNPAGGLAYFAGGDAQFAELSQDVPLAAYAQRIDAGGQAFAFAGRVRTRNESPSDVARIVVEYRDGTNTVVLDAFDTGEIASPFEWRLVEDDRPAPAGARFVRVRLLATRFTVPGTDGYFDALSLVSLRAPALTIADATVYEAGAAGEARFAVNLSCPVAMDVTVDYATADGTATAGTDYQAVSGSLSLPAGTVSRTVAVPVLGDAAHERHETFFVNLTNPAPAAETVLADPQGLGLLVNDDFCPRSPGFWKTHSEVWPSSSLVLGGRRYGATDLAAFLAYGGPDASRHLSRQLVATKLNLLVGSPPSILPVVDAADAFLADFPPGSNPKGADRARADSLKNQLDAYNNSSCAEVPVLP